MRIVRVRAWQVDLPLTSAVTVAGISHDVFTTTVVELGTDSQHTGWGEVCPLGGLYQDEHPAGVLADLIQLAPALIQKDFSPNGVQEALDRTLRGGQAAKAAMNMAAWDLEGKAQGVPVYRLLGGRRAPNTEVYGTLQYEDPRPLSDVLNTLRSHGIHRFQIKVARGTVDEDLERLTATLTLLKPGEVLSADANGGWLPSEAVTIAKATDRWTYFMEEPCGGYDATLSVRRRTTLPIILDESISRTADLIRAIQDDACDGFNLKLGRLGGVSKLRLLRDICTETHKYFTCEDLFGSALSTAASAHLGVTSSSRLCLGFSPPLLYTTEPYGSGAHTIREGRVEVGDAPGLGVDIAVETLGDPCLDNE